MLFRKRIERACTYCTEATILDEENAVCKKHGVVDRWGKCRSFRYDPLKREPETDSARIDTDFDESDFKIRAPRRDLLLQRTK